MLDIIDEDESFGSSNDADCVWKCVGVVWINSGRIDPRPLSWICEKSDKERRQQNILHAI